MNSILIPALIFYFLALGLLIALIVFAYLVHYAIAYIIAKNKAEKIIQQNLFHLETKILSSC